MPAPERTFSDGTAMYSANVPWCGMPSTCAVRCQMRWLGPQPEGRVDDDARPDGGSLRALAVRGDRADAVGTGDARELDPGIQALADEDVAAVERGAADLHQRLARTGRRIVDLLDAEELGTALAVDLVEADGSHPARYAPRTGSAYRGP